MLGCLSSLSKDISLIAVHGTPSSSESSLIRFKATISPVSRIHHANQTQRHTNTIYTKSIQQKKSGKTAPSLPLILSIHHSYPEAVAEVL